MSQCYWELNCQLLRQRAKKHLGWAVLAPQPQEGSARRGHRDGSHQPLGLLTLWQNHREPPQPCLTSLSFLTPNWQAKPNLALHSVGTAASAWSRPQEAGDRQGRNVTRCCCAQSLAMLSLWKLRPGCGRCWSSLGSDFWGLEPKRIPWLTCRGSRVAASGVTSASLLTGAWSLGFGFGTSFPSLSLPVIVIWYHS